MDQHAGQIEIGFPAAGIQWPVSKHRDNLTISVVNSGPVSVEVSQPVQVTAAHGLEPMKNDFSFPVTFVLRPGEHLLVPLGSIYDIARRLNVDYFDQSARYDITTDTTVCMPSNGRLGLWQCHFWGFAIITRFTDIFGEKYSVTTPAFLRIAHYAVNQPQVYILEPK
jgi:hypothetical protein